MTEQKPRPITRVKCEGCDRVLPHYAKGLCRQCYRKQYVPPKPKEARCKKCWQWKVIHAKELCRACYMKEWREKKSQAS